MTSEQYIIGKTLYSHERYSIFEAQQHVPSRPVLAHKLALYYTDKKDSMDLCLNRIKIWAGCTHPHLLEIIDCWRGDSDFTFITRRPNGMTAVENIEASREISTRKAFQLGMQAASCLQYLHQQDEPSGHLDLDSFVLEYDEWLVLSRPGWGFTLNSMVEEQNFGLAPGDKDDKRAASLQDLTDWGALIGALITGAADFGYKSMSGRRIKEVDIDQARSLLNRKNLNETLLDIILKALLSTSKTDNGYMSFDQLIGDLGTVRL
jgi:hypothetical protein